MENFIRSSNCDLFINIFHTCSASLNSKVGDQNLNEGENTSRYLVSKTNLDMLSEITSTHYESDLMRLFFIKTFNIAKVSIMSRLRFDCSRNYQSDRLSKILFPGIKNKF
ncbi:CLUMA_CG012895, isoform A [Clunio marinus]|uniref:CLUMA_CG012895, isoform A n=1 Tax=Clunio marinus TaxID=568069 RepID=A0A1J1IH47_9DIPT|nr:CLUMA_CG012895, isoform A [Clunio marinus]